MTYTNEEYQVYLKVQKALLMEDARNFVADVLADARDVEPEDIDDDELDRFDFESMVKEYEQMQDCNVAFNDTWVSIASDAVQDYLYEIGEA